MILIYPTTDRAADVRAALETYPALRQLVGVAKSDEDQEPHLSVGETIQVALDWLDAAPPYLFPFDIPYSRERLLSLVYTLLEDADRALTLLSNDALANDIRRFAELKVGDTISPSVIDAYAVQASDDAKESYRKKHNLAITRHYGTFETPASPDELISLYDDALDAAPNGEYRAFTAKHCAILFCDAINPNAAIQLIEKTLPDAISESAYFALQDVLVESLDRTLAVPYDDAVLNRMNALLKEATQFYAKRENNAKRGLLLQKSAKLASLNGDFAHAHDFLNEAIDCFEADELEALSAFAFIDKGELLHREAQSQNPTLYRKAAQAYQEALRVFKKDNAPQIFADIQQCLGMVFLEMPDEEKKKNLWLAVSASSFKEALEFYTKESHPYQYALICNNLANVHLRFPQGGSDNDARAIDYYNEALSVQEGLPVERSMTLLNYLEASWQLLRRDFTVERFRDMQTKAREVKSISPDASVQREADKHLEELTALAASLNGQFKELADENAP